MKLSRVEVVKKSISLSKTVSEWGDALAKRKGFGSNYSAYIADLIRRDKERLDEMLLLEQTSSRESARAAEQFVAVVQKTARAKLRDTRRKQSRLLPAVR